MRYKRWARLLYSLVSFFVFIPLGLFLVAVPWVGFLLVGLLLFGVIWLPTVILDLVPVQKDGDVGMPTGPTGDGDDG